MHTNEPIRAPELGFKPTPADNQPSPTFSPINVEDVAAAPGIAYHKVYRQQQLEFSEENQQANWGKW